MIPGALELKALAGEWLANYPPARGGWAHLARDAAGWAAEGVSLATSPARCAAAATELANRGRVFALVRTAALRLGTATAGFPPPVGELLRRAYRLGDFPALWAVEGLGHDLTLAHLERGTEPTGLLRGPAARRLPARSRLMLHAGLGLAFAEHLFADARLGMTRDELRRRAERQVELCRANSRPGDLGAAVESLGLFVALFQAPLTVAVERALREVAPEMVDYYWHGAGRAFYFRPTAFVPGGSWQALDHARRLAPDRAARRNVTAGFAWAVTLVNQRQPRVLEELLIAPHGAALRRDPGFANGVASSTAMRCATTPGAPFVGRFRDHRPQVAGAAWRRLVGRPCRRAMEVYLPELRRTDRLGELFRYHDLERLTGGGAAWS